MIVDKIEKEDIVFVEYNGAGRPFQVYTKDLTGYDFFYKDREFPQDLVLVGPALLWPELLENFPGKKMLMAKNY